MIKVSVFNEFIHEKQDDIPKKHYPDGIHMTLKAALEDEFEIIKTITLDNIDDLNEELLKETDVFIWWGHMAHHLVPDEKADMVRDAVLGGMGIIFLHSGHHSKPFKALMGTSCNLSWREDGDRELLWVCKPSHPIAKGINQFVLIEHEETYSEPFGIPEPDELVFIGSFEGGEVMRSGCCWKRENGKVFYFQPGHESFPIYHDPEIIKIIKNAINWAKPECRIKLQGPNVKKPLEGRK